jgi:hypothetical protein
MRLPEAMPPQKSAVIHQLVTSLATVPGVVAVVLGGSYASNEQTSSSDVDLGLYYWQAAPFATAEIRRIARGVARRGSEPTVTDFYEWGAWVNGGAWIDTDAGKVDLLYRNVDQVSKTIQDAGAGIIEHDYEQQPATGFYSVAYLAETQICLALHDPAADIARLKQAVAIYPPKLKQRIVADSLWGAEFSLHAARGFAAACDVYGSIGCIVRSAACLTQALFALNERYFLSDKRAVQTLATFPLLPPSYLTRMTAILSHPGASSMQLTHAVAQLTALWKDVVISAGALYQPKYVI